jgi:hypothetical protein
MVLRKTILLGLLAFGFNKLSAQDKFAEIATRSAVRTQLLVEPKPAVLPNKILPPMVESKKAFLPMDIMDTKEELVAALKKMKEQHAVFLEDKAPAINKTREITLLDKFQWRVETAADRADFMRVLNGGGSWETVRVPHFGKPIGTAVTYYRKIINVSRDALSENKALIIKFKAVDYKADVFFNGHLLGSHEGIFGAFELDASKVAKEGDNVLLVRVSNDYGMLGYGGKKGDKVYAATNLGFDDPNDGWHHGPPGMGIWQDVTMEIRPTLHFTDIFVRPIIEKDSAEIWLELNNASDVDSYVNIRFSIFGQNFEGEVVRDQVYTPATIHIPGTGDLIKPTDWEKKNLAMKNGLNYIKIPVKIKKPKLWSPETPWLYQLQANIVDKGGAVIDAQKQQFGMRSFTMDTISKPKGMMYLNGKPLKLRGANTMGHLDQCVFKKDFSQLVDDILLAKLANMNFLRMTQRVVQPEVYEYADRLGLMLQSDLPIFGVIRRNKLAECVRQAGEMEKQIRKYASSIMVSYINEKFPNGEGEPQRNIDDANEMEAFFRAANEMVLLQNPDRVIKPGDGDYDPPTSGLPDAHCYNAWYNSHGLELGKLHKGYWQLVKPDWYYACGEFGAEGLEDYAIMKKYYPTGWLPQNAEEEKTWRPERIAKSQTYNFHFMWFTPQTSVQSWIAESQRYQAWATKYYTEAFRRDNRMISTAIHLFIDAWPAGWMKSIMDVDRNPKPAFFAYRNGMQPLMVQARTDRYHFKSNEEVKIEAWVCNDKNDIPKGATVSYQWEQNGVFIKGATVAANIQSVKAVFQGYIVFKAPIVAQRTTYQLRISLADSNGKGISESVTEIDVFPASEPAKNSVFVVGSGNAKKLLTDLGMASQQQLNSSYTGAIVIDDYKSYLNRKAEIDAAVENGATCIFLPLQAGAHVIGKDSVEVRNCTMGSYYFVSPTTGHSITNQFKDRDFFFWYDAKKEYVSPLVSALLYEKSEGWNTILRSGQTAWFGANGHANAASEKKVGKGKFIISQIALVDRVKENPTAALFARKLLGVE